MAGGELYGVWVQTITNDTTAANVAKYGEIEDMAQAYRDGFAKDFCDGQTSPTPPRWPDDGMQLIYTYDPESARLISEFLRGDIQERVAAGSLSPAATPSWIGDLAQMGLDTAAKAALFEGMAEAAAPEIAELTRSQIEGRLAAYIAATGNARPSVAELIAWIEEQE